MHSSIRRRSTTRLAASTAAGILALSLSACAGASQPSGNGGSPSGDAAGQGTRTASTKDVKVVATTTMLGDIAKQITTCAGGETTTLMPQGTDPHEFKLSSQQATELVKATLVVANGLELEHSFEDVLDNAGKEGGKVLTVADKVDPIPFGEHAEEGHDEHAADSSATPAASEAGHDEHEHGSQDPHFWLDASRGAKAAQIVGDRLKEITGDAKFAECGAKVRDGLLETDKKMKDTLSYIPAERRILITDHEAFGYFAKRYGFKVAGVVVPGGSTEGEPSSADIAKLVKVIKDNDVHAIFSNTAVDPKLVQSVAAEVGGDVRVVPLYAESLSDADGVTSYNAMLEKDAQLIADALGGK